MSSDRIDFTGVDPVTDARRYDDAIRRIVASGMAARAAAPGESVWSVLFAWRRPALATATLAALAACAILAFVHPAAPRARTPASTHDDLALALGAPSSLLAAASGEMGTQ